MRWDVACGTFWLSWYNARMKKSTVLWLLALLPTLLLAVYQRLSGPTHPLKATEGDGAARVTYRLYRSWTSHRPLPVRVAGDGIVSMRLLHRRFPPVEGEEWAPVTMKTRGGAFVGDVPGQPAAGKVAYRIEAVTPSGSLWLNGGEPVVARFKDEVPAWALVPHVLFMFAGLLLAFRTGLGALLRLEGWERLLPWTVIVTAAGGLFLGPLVQKYAFGSFWTGFPLGRDLTDTKTLFVILIWLAALFLKRKSRWWTVAAMLLMIGVYMIPHSILGSELDYKTGKIVTAK